MKRIFTAIILVGFAAIMCPAMSQAAPDQYIGDTAIYGGQPSTLQPNVLVIIDTSTSMDSKADSSAGGVAYNKDYSVPYIQTSSCNDSAQNPLTPCLTTAVYDVSYGYVNGNVDNIAASCTFAVQKGSRRSGYYKGDLTVTPQATLKNNGQYNGPQLRTDGTACCYQDITIAGTLYPMQGQCANSTYYLGNYINWYWAQPQGNQSKISIAREVIGKLIDTTYGVNFGVMTYQYATSTGQGAELLKKDIGVGTDYIGEVRTMDDIFTGATGTKTNRAALILAVNGIATSGNTPTGESLFEAMRYFGGKAPAFGSTIGIDASGLYTSPIEYSCQKNYVILITDGMANADDSSTAKDFIEGKYGITSGATTTHNYNGGYCTGYGNPTYSNCKPNDENHLMAGVAKYMYEYDLKTGLTTTNSTQNNVITYTIGFGLGSSNAEAVELLKLTADSNHGRGADYLASSAQTLNDKLTKIINKIYQVNSSFVAPVVPVNPENKLQFGSRVYMGFFQPGDGGFWKGNLKKFGLGKYTSGTGTVYDNQVLDVNDHLATYADSDGNGVDDRDGAILANDVNTGAVDGSFRVTSTAARSYWTTGTVMDSGKVDSGGVGALLMSRNYSIAGVASNITGTVRNIYTYTGTSANLTDTTNHFLPSNTTNITATLLGLPGSIITSATTTDVKKLVNFVHGFDVYDETGSGNTNTDGTIKKRQWIMGDVLHSKPLVVSYATFTYTEESDCTKNKNMIYVGTNDGMIHAFNDCDGAEAWAFIPPDLLPNLQYLRGNNHTYFVDSSIQDYKYDKDLTDGAIASSKNDSVILMVGLRRGGGLTTEPGKGYYYALDVTTPTAPTYLWKISNATTGFEDLGEAWSEPKIGKIAVGTDTKIAAFIGGGYDNCNEDNRFGATQLFSGSCVNAIATADGGLDSSSLPITSSGSLNVNTFTTSATYKGRGVYVVEIAKLQSTGILSFANSGSKIWGYTFNDGKPLQFSMLSEMAAVDLTGEGYVDRLYMGDSGGNMWRFDLSSASTSSWAVTKIFTSNPGYTNGTADSSYVDGRKIFYRPAVVPDTGGIVRLYFGTGDREHPLNRAVVDRIYGLIDKGQTSHVNESKMLDVTTDLVQAGTDAEAQAVKNTLALASNATNTTQYGWYIRLDGQDRSPAVSNPGEKVLATAGVAAGTVFMTTYSPSTGATTTTTSTNPCQLGNLGDGSLYVLDYLYGGAVVDYDPTNNTADKTKLRTDRKRKVGSGIPSSAVIVCAPGNTSCKWLVGCGGGICTDTTPPAPGALVSPVYWRQK